MHVQRDKRHIVWRDCRGQHHAALVVVLLDGGAEQPSHADSVAAHQDEVRLAVLVRILRLQHIAVARAELEDMPDFDTAPHNQLHAALNAEIAGLRERDVVHDVRLEVAVVVSVAQVVVRAVRAGEEIRTHINGIVRDDADAFDADRRCGTRGQPVRHHLFLRGETQVRRAA